MSSQKVYIPGDFSFLENDLKDMYQYDYSVLSKMNSKYWDTLRKHFEKKKFSKQILSDIKKNLHYSHTSESLEKSIHVLGFIASCGWDEYFFLTCP